MSLRVVYFGTYRAEYARNQILIEGLRRSDIEVVECHQALWQGVEDRVRTASGGWKKPAFWWRLLRTYAQLLKKYHQVGSYDILVVGYPGQLDVFLAWMLAGWRRKPLVWDVLNSLYLITTERGIQERSRFTVQMIRQVERLACRLPNILLLDTPQFIEWFQQTHDLDPARFRIVQIGADDRYFHLLDAPQPDDERAGSFRVIYYGSYIPNHGVVTVIEAARLLESEPIVFEMIGDGPERVKAQSLAVEYNLKNVLFIDWLDRQVLTNRIARANLVLGVFGTTQQNLLTNNNKIYEGFAMRKPVISASTPALPAVLEHGLHLYLCQRGNPQSLADAIRHLRADPALCQKLAKNGWQIFQQRFDITHIGQQFAGHLEELASKP
jgi:glycosyltransferase involved in cell wall biosynthesis